MQLPEFMRLITIRRTMHDRLADRRVLAALPPERRLDAIDGRLKHDPRRVQLAGLFDRGGRRIAGVTSSACLRR